MKWGALFGWGITIYAVMYLVWSGFILYGFIEGGLPKILGLVVLVTLSIIAGRALRVHGWHDVLPYSVCWAITIALLDAVFSVPYSGWQLYADWNVWVGYLLVGIVPLLAPYTRARHPTDAS